MFTREELAGLFSHPLYGSVMAVIFLLVLFFACYHGRNWLKSIEETRRAVFGSPETKGLKTRVNALEEHRLNDRKDIDHLSAKMDHNHEQVLECIKALTENVSSNQIETAGTLGEILGYLESEKK